MPTSDSEDFESADEGHGTVDKKERKKRHSSSNYSDNTLESDGGSKKGSPAVGSKATPKAKVQESEGWDDFDIEDNEQTEQINTEIAKESKKPETKQSNETSSKDIKDKKSAKKSQDTGWDDFDDWGEENNTVNNEKAQQKPQPDIQEVTDRLAATTISGGVSSPSGIASTNREGLASTTGAGSSGWGWGWGVDSLLSTATAGITTITSQVTQGITTVLETGIGAPNPEELARKTTREAAKETDTTPAKTPEEKKPEEVDQSGSAGDGAFPFGSIFKFVGDTGSKVITGGLDTLETIGRKTMEVLQDGDPGLAKKRAMLGLDPNKPVLSQVLREAKAKAEEEDRVREEKREAKEVHYENLFDDFEGLVHLEALEMLSRQVRLRIDESLRSAGPEERQDKKETLQQVSELCEMPEEDEEEEEEDSDIQKLGRAEAFHERLQRATDELGVKLQFQPLVKQYTEVLAWLSSEPEPSVKVLYKRAISSLAHATALSMELYHKAAEMLLVKTRRSTADEADSLTQLTVVLTKHMTEMASLFTERLSSISTSDTDSQANTYITNIFLEAGNSSTYIQNAFQLAQPIVQIGAI